MSKENNDIPSNAYREFIFTNNDSNLILDKNKSPSIKWYEEKRNDISSMYEAQEYISSEIYSKILNDYTGYKTTDSKLAFSLLFQLIQAKTIGYITKEVYANIDIIENRQYYQVWIE
ncbi:hypothetical protein [Paenibacillus pini]|uniref:hypothetical protein n=1 Tax=Paenibacillus pini TaxID=669461 RepID=UPI00055B1316|nr:hypothetical protein [Paenibacillus pini]